MLEWISNPTVLCAVTGGGLLGLLGLWITARIELSAVRHEVSDSRLTLGTQVQELSASLTQLRSDQAKEKEARPAVAGPGRSLNLTKRSQIVRMHRRGETEASIAAALQAPRNEVELVLKLEKMLNAAALSKDEY
jgi:hypothetical protein